MVPQRVGRSPLPPKPGRPMTPRSWRRKRENQSCPIDGGTFFQIAAGVFKCSYCGAIEVEGEE